MKKFIKTIAFAITLISGLNAFSQTQAGGPKTISTCEAQCPFGSCKAKCESNVGAAACGCVYGFPACGCGGSDAIGPVGVDNENKENLNLLLQHLQVYTSVEAFNLRLKVQEYRSLADSNPEANFNPLILEIIATCETLNVIEKTNYTNFLSTLIN